MSLNFKQMALYYAPAFFFFLLAWSIRGRDGACIGGEWDRVLPGELDRFGLERQTLAASSAVGSPTPSREEGEVLSSVEVFVTPGCDFRSPGLGCTARIRQCQQPAYGLRVHCAFRVVTPRAALSTVNKEPFTGLDSSAFHKISLGSFLTVNATTSPHALWQ